MFEQFIVGRSCGINRQDKKKDVGDNRQRRSIRQVLRHGKLGGTSCSGDIRRHVGKGAWKDNQRHENRTQPYRIPCGHNLNWFTVYDVDM